MLDFAAGPLSLAMLLMFSLVMIGCASTGSPSAESADSTGDAVLRHVVMFKFKDSATPEEIAGIDRAFRALPGEIDAIIGFEGGVNNSPEGLDRGFTHIYTITFADEKGRDIYLPHPAHKAFVAKLLPLLDEPMVMDYWSR